MTQTSGPLRERSQNVPITHSPAYKTLGEVPSVDALFDAPATPSAKGAAGGGKLSAAEPPPLVRWLMDAAQCFCPSAEEARL